MSKFRKVQQSLYSETSVCILSGQTIWSLETSARIQSVSCGPSSRRDFSTNVSERHSFGKELRVELCTLSARLAVIIYTMDDVVDNDHVADFYPIRALLFCSCAPQKENR